MFLKRWLAAAVLRLILNTAYVGFALLGLAAALPWAHRRGPRTFNRAFQFSLIVLLIAPLAGQAYDAMEHASPFWPSSSKTSVGDIIPSHFQIGKAAGDCDAALKSLRTTQSVYPRDRITALQRVLKVDPEEVFSSGAGQ